MNNDIMTILSALQIQATGRYENKFYIIDLADSNEYAKMYTTLSEHATNTEYPSIATNTNKATVKITNYFELEKNNTTYNIFLIADFENNQYYIKIGEN